MESNRMRIVGVTIMAAVIVQVCGCPAVTPPEDAAYVWTEVAEVPGAALTAIHGTSKSNVYAVGADDGTGPIVLHWDGSDWAQLETAYRGDLWWVYAIDDEAFMVGANSSILRYADGAFERMDTPGLGKTVVYGLWGASATDVYAVGSVSGRNGFIWHYDGSTWTALSLPTDLPQDDNHDVPQFLKVWGTSADEVFVCGERGVLLRGNAADGFELISTPNDVRLFTVHGIAGKVIAVGGALDGVVVDVDDASETTVTGSQLLQGVWVAGDDDIWATGLGGNVYRMTTGGFEQQDTGITLGIESLHAVWVDEEGGVWTVGGNVLSSSLDDGMLLYGHPTNAAPKHILVEDPAETVDNSCPANAIDTNPEASIARRWNEQLLNAIRRDTPRPTVHARNLFHTSAAMWDAWAAYDDTADGYLVQEKLNAVDVAAAREEAISYAAYRLLAHRYGQAVGGAVSTSCFDAFMDVLGYDTDVTTMEGDSPAALGNRIAQAYIDGYANDGANEANNYTDPDGYAAETPRLVVDQPGSKTDDPTQWQQIVLAEAVTQNGIPEGSGVRAYVGAHWRDVTPFAMERSAPGEPYFILDAPTTFSQELVDAAVELIRKSSELDADDGVMVDISPGAYGNNTLGTNDGSGHTMNPATGLPYEPEIVRRGDFTRLLSEFWADGPASETPPGHWNTVANDMSDYPGFERRLFGTGEELDPLSWDVHVYLALNGAVHDAAIAAWELKRTHLTARPITLIRTLAARGQSSDPEGPSYDPDGLPLVDNLIEVITEETSADGERHAHLRRYIGEIAVRTWRGEPGDRKNEVGGVGWIRGIEWIPYQRRTFVTPAFPGFVSGHSTFSRSAAEVLTEITGSPYFPGGLGGYVLDPGWLTFEEGPTATVELRWATYYDASDQAGQSRLWGGIHVVQDDFGGRIIGSEIGKQAIALARTYYEGTADE
ncbi:MAG: hypothetical protein H6817_09955 [Phycisphaerales bacterium]|nr:hypothetical protein [Phycisphaerales bacterium]